MELTSISWGRALSAFQPLSRLRYPSHPFSPLGYSHDRVWVVLYTFLWLSILFPDYIYLLL
jgi:hypothetical protein